MKNKKSIGLWSAVSIGIGGMIGAGIFSILGVSAQIAGHAMYISFIIAGLIALLCALCHYYSPWINKDIPQNCS